MQQIQDVFTQSELIYMLEMARLAIAYIPEDVCDVMDMTDEEFVEIRDKLQQYMDGLDPMEVV